MEYIEVNDSDVQPITEPLEKSYLHVTSTTALVSDTMYEFMRQRKESKQEAFVFINPDGSRQGSLTFKTWVKQSENVAVGFSDMDIRPRDKVGMIVPNCEEFILTVGGLLHCAALPVFLTFDLKNGQDIATKINDTEMKAIVIHIMENEQWNLVTNLFKKILEGEKDDAMPALKHVVVISETIPQGTIDFKDLLKEKTVEEKLSILSYNDNVTMDSPCWINLTSGSTGKPKYCLLSHKTLVNTGRVIANRVHLKTGSVFFNDRPMSWVMGNFSIGFVLAAQHTLVTVNAKETVKNSKVDFSLQVLEKENVNFALLMPYLLYDVINMEAEKREKYDLSALKMLLTGGQRIDPCLIEQVKSVLDVGITIGYGSTEAGFITLYFPQADFMKQHLTVGYGLPHTEISIKGENNDILPTNTQGEICARGYNIFPGYLNNKEKTEEVIDNYGWYHTGDIGSMTPYGYLIVHGRFKEFIKRGTVIVQPAKIEHILLDHPSIHQVQVVGVPDPRLYEELCACIKVKDGHTLTDADMKAWCKNIFGDFTADGLNNAPTFFYIMDELPVLANGKIDRISLKEIASKKFGRY